MYIHVSLNKKMFSIIYLFFLLAFPWDPTAPIQFNVHSYIKIS